MKKPIKIVLIVLCLTIILIGIGMISSGIYPTSLNLHESHFKVNDKVLSGYDLVSYFDNAPLKGNKNYKAVIDGETWFFSSEENKLKFINQTNQYHLACGGYCAFAISKGFTAPSDPTIFHVEENQLFLFSNEVVKKEFIANLAQSKNDLNKSWKAH